MSETGTNAGGYLLNSIQLAMADASGTPSGFTVMLYAYPAAGGICSRGSSLGTLNGSLDPVTAAFTLIPRLQPSRYRQTPYFIVLTAGTAVANGAYEWSYAGRTPIIQVVVGPV